MTTKIKNREVDRLQRVLDRRTQRVMTAVGEEEIARRYGPVGG